MTHVDPAHDWYDFSDPEDRARWRAMVLADTEKPKPLSAYRTRKSERVIPTRETHTSG